jgi:outer membrane protein OmpA-like peptidoglycan-associated protein
VGALSGLASADNGQRALAVDMSRLVAVGPTAASDLEMAERETQMPRAEAISLPQLISSIPVRFGRGRSKLGPIGKRNLRRLVVPVLLGFAVKKIRVEGHADLQGSAEINQKIAQQRAEEAGAYLIQIGVPADMITIDAAGSSHPLVADRTPVAGQVNRRVELHLGY